MALPRCPDPGEPAKGPLPARSKLRALRVRTVRRGTRRAEQSKHARARHGGLGHATRELKKDTVREPAAAGHTAEFHASGALLSVACNAWRGNSFLDLDLLGTTRVVCRARPVDRESAIEIELPGRFVRSVVYAIAQSVRGDFIHTMLFAELFGTGEELGPDSFLLTIGSDPEPPDVEPAFGKEERDEANYLSA